MDTPNCAIHRGPFHMGGWPACAYCHRATDTITIATSGSNRPLDPLGADLVWLHHIGTIALGLRRHVHGDSLGLRSVLLF